MKTKIDFHRWYSMFAIQHDLMRKEAAGDHAALKAASRLDVDEVYDELTKLFTGRYDAMSVISVGAERWWYKFGQPYYKVWPQIALELGKINLAIDGKFLHLPYNTYEVCFPKEPAITEFPGGPRLTALLVSKMEAFDDKDSEEKGKKGWNIVIEQLPDTETAPDFSSPEFANSDGRKWQLVVHYQFDTDISAEWMGWFYSMGIYEGRTLEAAFDATWEKGIQGLSERGKSYVPDYNFVKSLVKIAISVAFFGVHDHQVVMPDIPNRYIDRYHRARKAGDKKEMDRLTERAKALHHFGWKVGSEIDLPEPVVRHINETGEKPERRELQFGHARSGHMRLQPFGPKEKPEYKLIFIRPTIVRPDLPTRAMHGYRLQDEMLPTTSEGKI